jgi:hypothetical protein
VRVAAKQRQHFAGIQAARDEGDRVAVGGEEPVVLSEGQRGGDLAGLLAGAGGVDGEAALLGEGGRLDVEPAAQDHQPVGLLEPVFGGFDVVAVLVDAGPVLGDEPDRGCGRQQSLWSHDAHHLSQTYAAEMVVLPVRLFKVWAK